MGCGTNLKRVKKVLSRVKKVLSVGFPASPSRIEQEMGRNRGEGVYVMIPSLKDFCYLWTRPSSKKAAPMRSSFLKKG
jgi:hypothetical protein